jgi:hypothetical protein
VIKVFFKRQLAVFYGSRRTRLATNADGKFLICAWFLSCASALAQTESVIVEPPSDDDALLQSECEELIAQLGASTFATRERAVVEILEIGMPATPFLRQAIENGGDPELVLRSKAILGQLTSGNFESKVARFLSGQDDGTKFDGWQTVEATLGDSPAIRDLFIQILRVHPDLIASLDGTTRERTVAAYQTAQTIQKNMLQNHQFPTLADGIALLLPLADPGVTFSTGYEATLVSVLRTQMSDLQKDALLWGPTSKLLNQWVIRSRIDSRFDVLWNSMQWDLSGASKLGLRTLEESTDVETLQTAMQAISRFGTVADAKAISRFLGDKRTAITREPIMVGDEALEVTIGDTALAAIALLYNVPLQDLGMTSGELHPKFGFLVDNAGYLPSKAEDRDRAISTVRGWLSGEIPPGKPRS